MDDSRLRAALRLLGVSTATPGQKWQTRKARTALKQIAVDQGSAPLSSAVKKQIRAYATEVLGDSRYRAWLEVYTAYRGEFLEGWMPEDFWEDRVLPAVNSSFRGLGAMKTLARKILRTDLLPDLAYRVNDAWYDTENQMRTATEISELLKGANRELYFKFERTFAGTGIFVQQSSQLDLNALPASGNCVVQAAVQQHGSFELVSPNCTATLRLLTGRMPGTAATLLSAHLRVGTSGAKFIAGASSIKIPVVDAVGSLGDTGVNGHWKRFTSHPDTGTSFGTQRIPAYAKALLACTSLHDTVPQLGAIGWDVTINTEEHVELLEWNTNHPGIKFGEALHGPSFRDFDYSRFATA